MADPDSATGEGLLARAIAAAEGREDGLPAGHRFAAPWQARAFATVLALQRSGTLDRQDWARRLGQAIREAQARGDPDLGDTYYDHFATALEGVLHELGIVDRDGHGAATADLLAHRAEHRHGLPPVPGQEGHRHD